MTKFQKQILSVLATGAVFASMVAPAFADELVINGNGADSNSTINLVQKSNTTVVQNNTANVTNNVTANASTGSNDANQNTGGSVGIQTGNATVNTSVNNTLNSNWAKVQCCASNGNTTVNVTGNGAESRNKVTLNETSNNSVFQNNDAYVNNNVNSTAKTGYNDANQNTGSGSDVMISTGNASVDSNVSTRANVNQALIGGNGGNGGSVVVLVDGNGFDSNNHVKLALNKDNLLTQNNSAYVDNNVKASAKTGGNDANQNTGADVGIGTGNASANATVDNSLNFNVANIDCGCITNLTAKVKGNGFDSTNKVEAKLTSDQAAFQDNVAELYNDVHAKAKTGGNDANQNTGPAGSDPVLIFTGDATDGTSVKNWSNANVFGSIPLDWPWLGTSNLHFTFDWGGFSFNVI